MSGGQWAVGGRQSAVGSRRSTVAADWQALCHEIEKLSGFDCLAEGEGRRTRGEFANQLSIAHGSIRELETHVMLAGELLYLKRSQVEGLLARLGEVGRLVTGLTNSLKQR